MKTIKELHVLVGLPGSGKTTFASQYSDRVRDSYGFSYVNSKAKKFADIIDYDAIYKKVGFNDKLQINKDKILKMALPRLKYDIMILDGLFVTQEDVEWVLSVYLDNPKFTENFTVEKIIVDSWIPDKEACLWNDRGRRNIGAAFSIKIMEQEKIDVKQIEKRFGIKTKLELHSIARKPDYRIFVEENDIKSVHDSKYLDSSTWSLGGEAWGWDGGKHTISPDEPCNFDEFDELIEKICPTITFLQYKKLYKNCVRMEERDNSDYYSSTREAYWRCDLKELWDMLDEMGLNPIKEE